MADLLPVAFHGDTLYLVEHNGEPFAPMKPIAENLGLNWEAQFSKLKTRFAATIANIAIVAEDGKQRIMVCLPLRKLAGWLYSITPAKVAPELRAKIEAYQAECDDALWRYWSEGHASRPNAPAPVAPQAAKPEYAPLIYRNDGKFMTPARLYAMESTRLLAHLVNESRYACPSAAAAVFTAAKAVAVDALNRIEIAEREANHA